MSQSTFDRIAAGGGIAFTVFGLSTLAIAPPAPAIDASATEVRSYLTEHHTRFGLSTLAMALAVLAIALAFGYIHHRLADTDRSTALPATFLVAGASTVTLALVGVLLQGVLAQHGVDGIDDSTLLALHRTWNVVAFMGPALPMTIALLLAAARTIRTGVFPRWLGWVAAASALGGITTAMMNLGTATRAPVVLDLGSFLLSCVWLTGISIHAMRGRRSDTRTARTPEPATAAS
jgi:hypothetical protein